MKTKRNQKLNGIDISKNFYEHKWSNQSQHITKREKTFESTEIIGTSNERV